MVKLVSIWTKEIGEVIVGLFVIIATSVRYELGSRNALCAAIC